MTATDPKQTFVTNRSCERKTHRMKNRSIKSFLAFAISLNFFAISYGAVTEEWAPPQNPDPEEIRREADKDIREERFELASQKYAWYHENALKYRPSLIGVRLSFALIRWRSLADQYPPALMEMKRAQDRAEERVRNREDASAFEMVSEIKGFFSFQDSVALNGILKEDNRTIDLFKWLGEHDPDLAHGSYALAQDVLVDAGEYGLCESYLTGRNSFDEILDDYKRQLVLMEKLYDGAENAPQADIHYMLFARRTAYIVVILVNRDRLSDAKIIAETAMQELESEELRKQVSDALRGIPPKRLM